MVTNSVENKRNTNKYLRVYVINGQLFFVADSFLHDTSERRTRIRPEVVEKENVEMDPFFPSKTEKSCTCLNVDCKSQRKWG